MVVMTPSIHFSDASVLITGGGEGIGRGLAARFLGAGSTVLITGRNPEKLDRAARELPGLKTFVNDIGKAEEREKLAACVRETIPALNIVVNNAGNQRRVSLAADKAPWAERQSEIDTLLCGPVHLNHLLVPTILSHGRPSIIVNVTSGGAYVPQPFAPIYSACKAALHSYTVNLRFALANTDCRVVEIIPPAVRTALAGPGATHGAPLDEFCNAVFSALSVPDMMEIGFGVTAGEAFNEPKRLYRALFEQFSSRFPLERYS
jgi:uncharacterized oxidoreductase